MIRADPDGLETYGGLLTLIRVCAEVSAAVLVTLAFAHWLGGGWQVFLPAAGALLVARYVLIGVGPRPLSKQRAEKIAGAATALLRPLRRALGPLPGLLDRLTGVLPIGAPGADPEFGGRPEVRSLVDYIEGQAEIEPGERDMVRSVFELGDTIVREVMVPRTDMVFIERDKTLDQALSLALRSGFSRIPVVGESIDDVVGIAYLKDVVAWEQEHPDGERRPSGSRRSCARRPTCRTASRWTSCCGRCRACGSTWRSSSTSTAARPDWSRSRTSSRRSWGRSPTSTTPSERRWSGSRQAPPGSRRGCR